MLHRGVNKKGVIPVFSQYLLRGLPKERQREREREREPDVCIYGGGVAKEAVDTQSTMKVGLDAVEEDVERKRVGKNPFDQRFTALVSGRERGQSRERCVLQLLQLAVSAFALALYLQVHVHR